MMKHCNKELEIKTGRESGKTLFYAECEVCKLRQKSVNKKEVENFFSNDNMKNQHSLGAFNELQKLPAKRSLVAQWGVQNMLALMDQSAQFIEKPATKKMIEENIRYISNCSGGAWDKVWSTPEGQESISHALAEANSYAATLGKMGDLVPFGSTAEFIPSVECFEFAMTKGKNAPFSDIKIYLIYDNDIRKAYQKDGNFTVELEYGIPRGEPIAVVVQATKNETGNVVGEIYDVKRLLEKAAHHSPSYRSYIKNKEDFDRLRSEGNLKNDSTGREYYIKPINTKDGTIWNKKIYAGDETNPYDGPDLPEMMRKSAGKSFFRPFMKTRNAFAMADEWEEDNSIKDEASMDQAADHVLKQAAGQFEDNDSYMPHESAHDSKDPNIKDAEIIVKKTTACGPTVLPEAKKEPEKEKEVEKKEDKEISEL